MIKINEKAEILEVNGDYRPSSEIKMHLRVYKDRPDVQAVVHAHPPVATAFALAQIPLDSYSLIESAIVIGSIPITPFGTPSTNEVPEAIAPYLPEHDVLLLENHGALTVGSDLITAYYRMETLELVAKTTFHARMLLNIGDKEEKEIPRENLERLFKMRKNYGVTGKHPGYKSTIEKEDKAVKKNVLAFDFGASSGRAILGKYDDGKIELEEIHRFSNYPVEKGGTLYWDYAFLFQQIIEGVKKPPNFILWTVWVLIPGGRLWLA